jgi:hypothetical protein
MTNGVNAETQMWLWSLLLFIIFIGGCIVGYRFITHVIEERNCESHDTGT